MTQNVYDVIIVGGGPGGLAAAIYGARSRLSTLLMRKVLQVARLRQQKIWRTIRFRPWHDRT